jgi:hypothetical protein
MNFRITIFFFALLLTMLWGFGLMIAHKKASSDQKAIMTSLSGREVKIDKVIVKKTEKGKEATTEFVRDPAGRWLLTGDGQKVRVPDFRVDRDIIDAIKNASHDETADVSKDAAFYGLKDPPVVVTLSGTYKDEPKEWQFFVGKESADKTLMYVNSSDRRDRAYAVSKKSLSGVLFEDPNHLRDRRIFDFVDTAVTTVLARRTDKGKVDELELKNDGKRWMFIKPPYGFAGFQSEPEEKKDPHRKEPFPAPAVTGVKGLLDDIKKIRVDDEKDFVPLGRPAAVFGLEKDKEAMRIEVTSSTGDDKKTVETLFLSDKKKEGKEEFYYARLASDDGVFKIRPNWMAPIIKAIDQPEEIRSKDIAAFNEDAVDAIVIKQGKDGKDETLLAKGEDKEMPFPKMPKLPGRWEMIEGKDKKKANDAAVRNLLKQVLGQRAIVKFHDSKETDPKKKEEDLKSHETKWGLNSDTTVTIAIYENGLEKKEEKKVDKKDDKKDAKKDEGKAETLPALKKDPKAEVTLAIGNLENDAVEVRRTLKDGTVTYFTVKKEFKESVLPAEGVALAYLETSTPEIAPATVTAITLRRTVDKKPEVIELEHGWYEGKSTWHFKDGKPADSKRVDTVLGMLIAPPITKWVKKIGAKDDIEAKYGLKNPVLSATLTVKKQTPAGVASLFGAIGGGQSPLAVVSGAAMYLAAEKGETVTIEFGKESTDDKDKGTFGLHSGAPNLVFLVPSERVKMIAREDLRDRSGALYTQVELVALYQNRAAVNPITMVMLASPYFTGVVNEFDPEKVKDVRLAVRTGFELRQFSFERIAKKEPEKAKEEPAKEKEKAKDEKAKDGKEPAKNGKDAPKDGKEPVKDAKDTPKAEKEKSQASKWTWVDKSNIPEFQLDPDKVAQLVKEFAKLRAERFVSIVGDKRSEYKLEPDKATIRLDLLMDDGKAVTVVIGARYQQHGYFATSTAWPDVVFFVSSSLVDPILQGTGYFSKERSN